MYRIARLAIVFVVAIGMLAALPATAALADSPATISASPQDVPFGQFTTTITWSGATSAATCSTPQSCNNNAAAVCVSANGSPQALFATSKFGNPVAAGSFGPGSGIGGGSQVAPFIESGTYIFSVYDQGDTGSNSCTGTLSASTTVHKLTPDGTANPSIVVTPPAFDVQAGVLSDTATVSWDTATGLAGQVAIVVNNADDHGILAKSSYGTVEVPWVQSGAYAFFFSYGGAQAKQAATVAKGGIALSAGTVKAGTPVTVTANSGTGAPVLICLNAHLSPTTTPFALGNNGVVSGTIALGAGDYNFNVYVPADGKTPLDAASLKAGTNAQPCTANTPLVPLKINGSTKSGSVHVT